VAAGPRNLTSWRRERRFAIPPPAPFVACAGGFVIPRSSDESEILALHRAAIGKHVADGFDELLSNAHLIGKQHGFRQFRVAGYRQGVDPVLRMSKSGAVAWLVAEVEAFGSAATPRGRSRRIAVTLTWIELYERHGPRWEPAAGGVVRA